MTGDKTRKHRNERGAIMMLFAMLITVLLGTTLFSLDQGYIGLIVTDVRGAADATALAAAEQIVSPGANGRRDNWDNARIAAIEMMNQQKIRAGLGQSSTVYLDPSNPTHIWDLPADNLRVTIERGFYSDLNGFESFELVTEASHPGIVPYAAFNAARVRVERPNTRSVGTVFGQQGYNILAESVAAASATGGNCGAPFAIEIADLIPERYQSTFPGPYGTEDDIYLDDNVCQGDRIFTNALHNCPYTNPGCTGAYMKHFTNPGRCSWPGTTDACDTGEDAQPYFDDGYFMTHNSQMNLAGLVHDVNDNVDTWGVVGLPASAGTASEANIRTILASTNGCRNGSLGESFNVLDAGLQQLATGNVLWNQIDEIADASHIAMSATEWPLPMPSVYEDDAPGIVEEILYNSLDDGLLLTGLMDGNWAPGHQFYNFGTYNGYCNSRRIMMVDAANPPRGYTSLTPTPPTLDPTFCQIEYLPGVTRDTTWWLTMIPVIMDFGEAGDGAEPYKDNYAATSSFGDWRIISYVPMYIYDLDIGLPVPTMPNTCKPTLDPALPAWAGGHDRPDNFGQPWGYSGATQCNMVRGRIPCGSNIQIATSEPLQAQRARLVR